LFAARVIDATGAVAVSSVQNRARRAEVRGGPAAFLASGFCPRSQGSPDARTGGLALRLDYAISLDAIEVPRFSVEAVEGIGKLFTLATLVLNVLDTQKKVEIVFHGLNPEDPERKIRGFKEIIGSSSSTKEMAFEPGRGGQVPGSSSYFQWLSVGEI